MILRAQGGMEMVGAGGLPIGLLDDAVFDTVELRLSPGDRMLFYSDGLTECPGSDGEQLEDDGLRRLITQNAAARGPAFLSGLEADLSRFSPTDTLPDDASALWLEYEFPDA